MKVYQSAKSCLIAGSTICVLLVVGCSRRMATHALAPLPSVQTVTLSRGTFTQTLPVSGTLNALPGQEATLVPQITGTLLPLTVQLGQSVRKGDIVAQVSSQQAAAQILQAQATFGQDQVQVQQAEANALQQEAQTQSNIAQANANIRSAQATLDGDSATLAADNAAYDNAQQNLTRQQGLADDGLVAEKDVEIAQLGLLTAKSTVDVQKKQIESQQQTVEANRQVLLAAKTGSLLDAVKRKDIMIAQQQVVNSEAALSMARVQASLYTLRSPLAGKVTEIGASPGETVDTATKLITVADLSRLQLLLDVPTVSVANIHPGERVTFASDVLPSRVFSATIDTVASQVDPATGTVPVYAQIANAAGLLKDNTAVSAKIILSSESGVITAPQNAILSDPDTGAKSVAVIDQNSVLHIVPVLVGPPVNGAVEIISGVSAGQRIAVSGAYGLADGTKVDAHDSNMSQNGADGT